MISWSLGKEKATTGWWFGTCFIFPSIGNNHPNWRSYFSEGWPNHQPDKNMMNPTFEDGLYHPICGKYMGNGYCHGHWVYRTWINIEIVLGTEVCSWFWHCSTWVILCELFEPCSVAGSYVLDALNPSLYHITARELGKIGIRSHNRIDSHSKLGNVWKCRILIDKVSPKFTSLIMPNW